VEMEREMETETGMNISMCTRSCAGRCRCGWRSRSAGARGRVRVYPPSSCYPRPLSPFYTSDTAPFPFSPASLGTAAPPLPLPCHD
jgi:hypothetical protein